MSSDRARHENYGNTGWDAPLEPWLIRARQLQEALRAELGGRAAHAQVRDTLGSTALLFRAECASGGPSSARWART